jgi:hypothetical protein
MFGIPESYWVVALGTFVAHELAWLAFNVPYLVMEKVGCAGTPGNWQAVLMHLFADGFVGRVQDRQAFQCAEHV